MVIKRFIFAIGLILMTLALAMSGCSKKPNEKSFGGVCELYLEALPEGYEQLPEGVREDMHISISLKSVSSNKKYRVRLTKANGYRQSLNVVPGTYNVVKLNALDKGVVMFDVKARVKSVTVGKDQLAEVPLYAVNSSDLIHALQNNQPTDEILRSDIYSRKVQYKGEIIDLQNIREEMGFTNTKTNQRLSPKETYQIPSASKDGVSIIVQNQSSVNAPVSEATFVGVSFSTNNVIFPKGITLGTSLYDIAHAQDGLLGTPDYCEGSAFVGAEFESTTLVYIDKDSGDRISFYVQPGNLYVSSITYEFAKYE